MALASLVGGENGPFLVGPLLAAVTVFGTYWLAACLHSRTAGVIAAALMASSPLLLSQVVQHMSDIPATALWTLALLAALAGRSISGGAVSGLAVLVRPSLLPVAGAVAIVLAIWSKPTLRESPRNGARARAVRRGDGSRRCGPRGDPVVALRRSACIRSRDVLRDVRRRQRAAQHSRLRTTRADGRDAGSGSDQCVRGAVGARAGPVRAAARTTSESRRARGDARAGVLPRVRRLHRLGVPALPPPDLARRAFSCRRGYRQRQPAAAGWGSLASPRDRAHRCLREKRDDREP